MTVDANKVAAVQMVSTPDTARNMETAERLAGEAAREGAGFVLLPEYWPIMGMSESDKVIRAEAFGAGPLQDFMSRLAARLGVWLVGGTIPLAAPEAGKVLNTTLAYDPSGRCVSRYDKIHLFSFAKGTEAYDEARTIMHGGQVGVFEAPFGRIGMSVCYDLRFPELYRAMGDCALIVVPAAFTYTTGSAHWEILLRARAVENQCYVLASAQGGCHPNGRRTWGHSMLIDPWGDVVATLPEGEGWITGKIDSVRMREVRESLPALKHRRL